MAGTNRNPNPMLRLALFALALSVSAAQAQSFALTLDNQARQAVASVAVYPVSARTGEPVEDVIGSQIGTFGPGATLSVPLMLVACGPVYVRVTMADESEVTTTLDICADTALVLRD